VWRKRQGSGEEDDKKLPRKSNNLSRKKDVAQKPPSDHAILLIITR